MLNDSFSMVKSDFKSSKQRDYTCKIVRIVCCDRSTGKTKFYLLSRRWFFVLTATILTTMCSHRCTPSIGIARMKPVSMAPVQSSQFEKNHRIARSYHVIFMNICMFYITVCFTMNLFWCFLCPNVLSIQVAQLDVIGFNIVTKFIYAVETRGTPHIVLVFLFRNKGQMVTSTWLKSEITYSLE